MQKYETVTGIESIPRSFNGYHDFKKQSGVRSHSISQRVIVQVKRPL